MHHEPRNVSTRKHICTRRQINGGYSQSTRHWSGGLPELRSGRVCAVEAACISNEIVSTIAMTEREWHSRALRPTSCAMFEGQGDAGQAVAATRQDQRPIGATQDGVLGAMTAEVRRRTADARDEGAEGSVRGAAVMTTCLAWWREITTGQRREGVLQEWSVSTMYTK